MRLTEEKRKEIEHYVLVMLGAPVLKIELEETQIDYAIDHAIEQVDAHLAAAEVPEPEEKLYHTAIKDGSYLICQLILKNIYQSRGQSLYETAQMDLQEWKNGLHEYWPIYDEANDPVFLAALTGLIANPNIMTKEFNESAERCIRRARKISLEIRQE